MSNSVQAGTETITAGDLELLKKAFRTFIFDVLGLREETAISHDSVDGLMEMILKLRSDAKSRKDFAASDKIRDDLNLLGFEIKDGKDGATWNKK